MSIKEIEKAIRQLSGKEASEPSGWLADYQASMWDEQTSRDLEAGRLDEVLTRVDAEYEADRAMAM